MTFLAAAPAAWLRKASLASAAASMASLLAPAGTPRDIVLKLNAEIIRGLNQPQTVARYVDNGVEVGAGSPEDFGTYIQRSRVRWSGVICRHFCAAAGSLLAS